MGVGQRRRVIAELRPLCSEWSDEVEGDVAKHWEQHGDLLILPHTTYTHPVLLQLGEKLWDIVCSVYKVSRIARKSTIQADGFRSPSVSMLRGTDTIAVRKENKIIYSWDVTRCMFSVGNITEKCRVAGWDCTGETVVDMYAGIGYFSLPYLVHSNAAHLHAVEWNPHSVTALLHNLDLNKVTHRCTVHQGDNRKVTPENVADRVNLGLIPSSEPGYMAACQALKSSTGGYLHIHGNVDSKHTTDNSAGNTERDDAGKDITHTDVCSGCQGEVMDSKRTASPLGKETISETVNACHTVKHCEITCTSIDHKDKTLWKEAALVKCKTLAWRRWAESTAIKIRSILCSVHGVNCCVCIQHVETVKSYAPHVHHLVIDLHCTPI